MHKSLINIDNTTHLGMAPLTLKLIAKHAEEGENLGIAIRSGRIGQAANNASCITGQQFLEEASINGIQGGREGAWVDIGRHRFVLAGPFNCLSA
jgi:hypothetical protein